MNIALRAMCVALLLGGNLLSAQEMHVDERSAIPAQKEGTVYLLNDSDRDVQFSLSYNARSWTDYQLDGQHACFIPVRDAGYEEVVIRYVEKPGTEQTFRLEQNERYRFRFDEALKEWTIERLR